MKSEYERVLKLEAETKRISNNPLPVKPDLSEAEDGACIGQEGITGFYN